MSSINDKATVSLFVNGEQAEKQMERLRKRASELAISIKEATDAGDMKGAKKLQREFEKVNKELKMTESSAKGAGIVLNNLSGTSLHGLTNALKYLQRELKVTRPGTDAWNRYAEAINTVKGRIAELNGEIDGGEGPWNRFRRWAEDTWPAIDLISRGYHSAVDMMRGYVDAYASMEQEMANVRKFTGMTEEEVAKLNVSMSEIDTRTSREELNKLAQEAGRLGKSSHEDVLGFVRAADQINVALDDLGSGATLTLSKLTGIFGDEKRYGTEKSLLKVGSVINELSQNCSASAPYLAAFAERMGGVGAQANMTIPQIMGLGAVLDANAQKVEASSTAVSQVIVRMMQDPAKYATVAGIEVGKFSRLIREDTNAALLLFLETLQKAGGMDVLSPMFKDMGENGSRAIAALSTLAGNIETVKAQQAAANDAFEEGTSIGKEFAVQNETVEASLEKARNRANEVRVELGEKLAPLMKYFMTSSSAVMRGLLVTSRYLGENKEAVASLAVAIGIYTLAVKGAAVAEAADAAVTKGLAAVKGRLEPLVLRLRVGYLSLTGQTYAAAKAQLALNAAHKASLWGLVLAGVTAVVGAIINYIRKTEEATRAQEEHARQMKAYRDSLTTLSNDYEKSANKEIAKIKALCDAAKNDTKSRNERLEAVRALQAQYPDYFGKLSTEQIMLGDTKAAYDSLVVSILKAARAKAAADKIVENEDRMFDVEAKIGANVDTQRKNDARLDALRGQLSAEIDRAVDQASSDADKKMIRKYLEEGKGGNKAMLDLRKQIRRIEDENRVLREETMKLSNERLLLKNAMGDIKTRHGLSDADIAAYRGDGITATGSSATVPPPGDGASPAADRFAEEKAWRDRMEAETKIAYSKGETDHREYTGRMDEIAVGYFSKILERQDLSAAERLETESQYWEAVNRQTVNGNDRLIAEENDRHQRIMLRLTQERADRLESDSMTAEQMEAQQRLHDEAVELAELNHLLRLVELTKEGSDERLKAETAYQAARMKAQERHRKSYEAGQTDYERRIASVKEKYFGDSDSEKKDKFDAEFDLLQEVYRRELEAASGNEAEISRIKEAYLAAELAMRREYNQVAATETENSYREAVMNAAQWLKSEGGQVLTGSLSSMTSGMASVFSGLSTMMQAELQVQTAGIESRYEREVELAQGNSYRVAQLEKKKEAEIAKVKNEANRKMFAMQVIQAVAQTAQNALAAFGSAAQVPVIGYILAPIAAAMAVAAGGIQIAAIKKQQQASEAQGYSKGGFTRKGRADEPAGVVHAGEWVASQRLLASPVARPMIEALDYVQRTNTIGSLRAEDVAQEIQSRSVISRAAARDSSALVLAALVSSSEAVNGLRERLDEPFVTVTTVTGDAGIKKAQDEYERLMNNKKPKSKRA